MEDEDAFSWVRSRVVAAAAAEETWAREVLAALRDGAVATLADGSMVDAAMARRARSILS